MEQLFVFVYSINNEIKALSYSESINLHEKLISEGWKHTHTLDACVYIQYLHNDCDNIVDEIKSLSK